MDGPNEVRIKAQHPIPKVQPYKLQLSLQI